MAEKTAQTRSGMRKPTCPAEGDFASNPPSAGPTMKPMLLAAPNRARRPARFSPGVTSAM